MAKVSEDLMNSIIDNNNVDAPMEGENDFVPFNNEEKLQKQYDIIPEKAKVR